MTALCSRRPDFRVIAAALVGLSFALLTRDLAQPSLWVDELFSTQIASAGSAGEVIAGVIAHERRPPFYHLLLYGWARLAGPSEFSLRLFSVFAGTLAVAGVAPFGRRLGGRRTGWIAGLLLAISPGFVLYGRMIRYYSLMAQLALLATLFFVRFWRRPFVWRSRDSLGYCLAALALLFTDYGAAAVIVIHNVFYLTTGARGRPPNLWRWLGAQALLVLAWGAWLIYAWPGRSGAGPAADLAGSPLAMILKPAYGMYAFSAGETLFPWNPAAWLALAVVLVAAWRTLWKTREQAALPASLALAPLLVSTALTTVVAADLSFVTIPSRSLHGLPFFVALAALGLVSLGRRPVMRLSLLGLLGAANLIGLSNLYAGREYLNPIYSLPAREIAQRIQASLRPGDVVVADWDSAVPYYLRLAGAPQEIHETPPPEGVLARLRQASPAPSRVWVVQLGRDRTRALEARAANLTAWLEANYPLSIQWHYGEQDPAYLVVKEALLHRPVYRYRATVTLYDQGP